jgi:hypothetical protein
MARSYGSSNQARLPVPEPRQGRVGGGVACLAAVFQAGFCGTVQKYRRRHRLRRFRPFRHGGD